MNAGLQEASNPATPSPSDDVRALGRLKDVVRVSHEDTVRDLARRGADVERQVLSRAVSWHCEDRILRDGNTTVVF